MCTAHTSEQGKHPSVRGHTMANSVINHRLSGCSRGRLSSSFGFQWGPAPPRPTPDPCQRNSQPAKAAMLTGAASEESLLYWGKVFKFEKRFGFFENEELKFIHVEWDRGEKEASPRSALGVPVGLPSLEGWVPHLLPLVHTETTDRSSWSQPDQLSFQIGFQKSSPCDTPP